LVMNKVYTLPIQRRKRFLGRGEAIFQRSLDMINTFSDGSKRFMGTDDIRPFSAMLFNTPLREHNGRTTKTTTH